MTGTVLSTRELGEQLTPGEAPTRSPELRACLHDLLDGQSLRVVGCERLKSRVHRVRVQVDGAVRSLVVKESPVDVARRNRLVAQRWLPAVGLQDAGPPLLAIAVERSGESAWHVYEDLPGRSLSSERGTSPAVDATVEVLARVHTAFARHRLLHECRHWGGDRGMPFYAGNVRDAIAGLSAGDLERCGADAVGPRDALLERMTRLAGEESHRAAVLAAHGGPETLVHGDLWPTNAIVVPAGNGIRVRLIDWDEAAVGPGGFDLATLLLRFDPSQRPRILHVYREAVGRLAGWRVPGERELAIVLETAAYARLASMLVWSLAAGAEGDPGWIPERLRQILQWIDAVALSPR